MKTGNKILCTALAAAMTATLATASFAVVENPVEEEEYMEAEEYVSTSPSFIGDYVSVTPSTEITDDAAIKEKLAEITLLVRNTIGIGDEYTSFSGDFSDNVTNRVWSLYWNNDNCSINVTAAEDGTVMRYNKYSYNEDYSYSYGNVYDPAFQKTTREDAQKSAESFLNRVLKDNESFELTDKYNGTLSTRGVSSFSFYATIKVNGLKTPLSANVTVSADKLEVTNFYRDDLYSSYYGGFPELTVNYDIKSALEVLSKKFTSDLRYYLYYDENDVNFEHPKAELRYTFSPTGDWFINAETGAIVDKNTLYDQAYEKGMYDTGMTVSEETEEAEMPAANVGGYELTDVEKESIEKLEGVLTGEQILKIIVEKYPEFGLDKYELSSASYSRYGEDEKITASLSFVKRVTSGSQIGMSSEGFKKITDNKQILYIRKYIVADGKTGELESYSTNYPYFDRKYALDRTYPTDTAAIAKAFLEKNYPEEFTASALTNTYTNEYNNTDSINFTNTVNGYTLNSNTLTVVVNQISGTVDSFNKNWTYGVEFGSADGIISAENALDIYATAYEAELSYITIPVEIDDSNPVFEPYVQSGYSYVSTFLAAYTANNAANAYAVKAQGGELMKYEYNEPTSIISYIDIDDCENKEKIEKLAEYGVTFGTNEFRPAELLTEKAMLIFLLNSMGYNYTEETIDNDGYLDNIYSQAVNFGFVEAGHRTPDELITREQAFKMIISATEYKAAAKLTGIFTTGYSDEDKISDDCFSYVAIAKALGLTNKAVKTFGAEEVIPREELAVIVYNFMDR